MDLIFKPELFELASVVKTICEHYKIPADELRVIPNGDGSLGQHKSVVLKKRVSIRYPIPSSLRTGGWDDNRNGWLNTTMALQSTRTPIRTEYDSSPMARIEGQIGEFEATVRGKKIRFWMWYGTFGSYYPHGLSSAVFAERKDVFSLLRASKEWERTQLRNIEPPVLPSEMLTEIYENSVGFLLNGNKYEKEYLRFKIPFKRGLLFCGRPGCGKTLTCKWLRDLCRYHKLSYRTISMGDYRRAASMGGISQLFRLEGRRKGIIFFDDMDIMVRDRKATTSVEDLSIFLAELDGLEIKEGIVYIFTTNYVKELDEAFVRPGRIDLYLPFNTPGSQLRRKFITDRFEEELQKTIDVDHLIENSDKFTFAELEEVRKLMCLDIIIGKEVDLNRTMETFERHRKDFAERLEMGFGKLNEDDDYNEFAVEPPTQPLWERFAPWRNRPL